MEIEHPIVTKINRTGYPDEEEKPVCVDYFGSEVYEGDDIVRICDEIVLADHLHEFLIEHLDAIFDKA